MLESEVVLAYLAGRAVPGVEVVDGETWSRTVAMDGDVGVLRVRVRDRGAVWTACRVDGTAFDGASVVEIDRRTRSLLGLDRSSDDAVAALSTVPHLRDLVRARPHLRVPGAWDRFEVGLRAIVGQQISVAGASTILGRLVARLGRPVEVGPGLGRLFPSPAAVARGDLTGLGLTTVRERTIRTFARAVDEGEVDLDADPRHPDVRRSLTALYGIGPWTAEYLALRFGDPDACPVGDLALRRSLAHLLDDPDVDVAAVAASWRPHRALAATHVWACDPGPGR